MNKLKMIRAFLRDVNLKEIPTHLRAEIVHYNLLELIESDILVVERVGITTVDRIMNYYESN